MARNCGEAAAASNAQLPYATGIRFWIRTGDSLRGLQKLAPEGLIASISAAAVP